MIVRPQDQAFFKSRPQYRVRQCILRIPINLMIQIDQKTI